MRFTTSFLPTLLLAIWTTAPVLGAQDLAEPLQRPAEGYYAQPRVEFSFNDEAPVRLSGETFSSPLKDDYADVETLLLSSGATQWKRLFHAFRPEQLDQMRNEGEARRGIRLPDLNNWFTVVMPNDAAAEALAARLSANPHIRSASATPLPVMTAADIAPTTPSFNGSQGYQAAAPGGVGVASAWAQPGGGGQGIRILHCEGGWVVDHEDYDLTYTGGGNDPSWWDHGTACVSILGARDNGYGVTGMTPSLDGLFSGGILEFGGPSAWIAAMGSLDPGDVISASWGYLATPAPGQVCVCNCGQFGMLPPEANQADFDAIQTVTASGYIVVVSAGNGSVPMDHSFYGGMFNLNTRDSGALIVAAIDPGGNPTCWTNHGSRIDAHAWGSAVTSAGYGDLFDGGGDVRQSYTSTFGGTSSACPIVSGCVAAAQGIHKAATGTVLDAWQFRTLLRGTGTPQTGSFTKLVSNQPDMAQLIPAMLGLAADTTPPTIVHTPLANTLSTAGPYLVDAAITDVSGIPSARLLHRVNGGAWTNTAMTLTGAIWRGSIPGRPVGSVIDYQLTATDGASVPNTATSPIWTFRVQAQANGIVLLTPSASPLSNGTHWATALAAAGYSGTIRNVDNLDAWMLGPQTDALVVLLGVQPNKHTVPALSHTALAMDAFVNSGGKVYLEGGDCWVDDPGAGGRNFSSLFGVVGVSSGLGDLITATGHGLLSTSHSYAGANQSIDRLDAAGAALLFSNDVAGYNCGYVQSGVRTTAAASFELAGLSGFQSIVGALFGEGHFNLLPGRLNASTSYISGSATVGQVYSETLTLSNTGHRTLSWNAALYPNSLAAAESRATGGPDSYGYTWIDSDQAGGPVVAFQDISASGTALGLGDEDNQGPFALGFPFAFYTSTFDSVRIASNGFLSFTSSETSGDNQPLPSGGAPETIIAPFWDDLNPAAGGSVHWQAFPDRFVVQWTAVPHVSGAGASTFQVILHDDHTIEVQYGDLADATSATVGVAGPFAYYTTGLQVAYDEAFLHDGMALRLAPWFRLSESSGTLAPGESRDVQVILSAADGLGQGWYSTSLNINTPELGSTSAWVEFSVSAPERVPAAITDLTATVVSVDTPNQQVTLLLDFSDVTQGVDGDPLAVDAYQLYASQDPYAPFPDSWYNISNVVDSQFLVIMDIASLPRWHFRATAVDYDGALTGTSPSQRAPRLSHPAIQLLPSPGR